MVVRDLEEDELLKSGDFLVGSQELDKNLTKSLEDSVRDSNKSPSVTEIQVRSSDQF